MEAQRNDRSSSATPSPSQSDTSEEEKKSRRRLLRRKHLSSDNSFLGDTSQENSTSPTSNSDIDPGLPRNDYLDFENCLLCKTEKKNISYPYCASCFTWRKNLIPVRKRIKRSKDTLNKVTLEGGATANGGVTLPQHAAYSPSSNSNKTNTELCRVCFLRPENGVFIHSIKAHKYGCYSCAQRIWKEIQRCPLCRRKVSKVIALLPC